MTTQAHETSMRTQITMRAPNVHAFKVFTQDFGRFKPLEHASPGALRRVTLLTLATRSASKPRQQRTMSFGPTRSHTRSSQPSGAGPLARKGDSE